MVRHFLQSKLWLVGFCLMLPSPAMAETNLLAVATLDGVEQVGELVAWDESGLTLRHDQQTISLPTSQLLRVQWRNAQPSVITKTTYLELVDGTRMPHQSYQVEGRVATITTPWSQQPLELSTEQIRYVQLFAGVSWQEIKSHELTEDLLVVRKKNAGAFSFLNGILGQITAEQVDFNWDEEEISVKRSKIAAVAYYHAHEPATKEFCCWLNLHHGGRLPVEKFRLQDKLLEITTSSGLKFSFPLDLVRDADFSQGKLLYLSDLDPVDVQWTPRIDLPSSAELIKQHGLPRRDQSFAGSMLSLAWPSTTLGTANGELKNYSKGLALRSKTELRYRLPAGMQRFMTIAGIDPETASQGNVNLEIFADRVSVWQGAIEGKATPVSINVPLQSARGLRIVVDYGANLDFGDRLHLVEARVSQ